MRRTFRRLGALMLAAAMLVAGGAVRAAEVQVAVAANFAEPAREIADGFARATGHKAVLSIGSSGQFYAEIAHGAPFEVFLSADDERPKKAEAEGLAVAGTRFTYAVGRLVLYSRDAKLVDADGKVLAAARFEHLAIADPATAPYGVAAVETLQHLKLYDRLKPKIVTGASIGQAWQFTQSGAADLGFVALSQVIEVKGGSRWLVPERLHEPIAQDAVLLKAGRDDPAAKAFLAYLRSREAKAIIRRFGYGTGD